MPSRIIEFHKAWLAEDGTLLVVETKGERTDPKPAAPLASDTIPVPVTLIRKLREEVALATRGGLTSIGMSALIDIILELPELPEPDPVKECCEAFYRLAGNSKDRMRSALRRYRDLGCPELPEKP